MKQLWYEPGNMTEVVPEKIYRIAAETKCFKDGIKLRSWDQIHFPGGWWL